MSLSLSVKILVVITFGLYLYSLLHRPDLLIVGSFTKDVVVGVGSRPGGAVSYSAVAARALGLKACVLTVAGPGVDEELSLFHGHTLHIVQGNCTLTFEHSYDGKGDRQLRVTADPKVVLRRSQLPWHCRRARMVLLGPLTPHDVDVTSFMEHDSWVDLLFRGPQSVGIIGQGYQRLMDAEGKVVPLDHPAPQLLERHGKRTSLFLSDVETAGWSAEQLGTVAAQHGRMVVTQGRLGAQEWNSSGVFQIDTFKVPQVDTNGAGDTFAAGYMVALAQGHPDPGRAAAWTASRAVMASQSCKPGCAADALIGHRIDGTQVAPKDGAPCIDLGISNYLCRPWSISEKLWADVSGLWPHFYAVLYDALAHQHPQPGSDRVEHSSSGSSSSSLAVQGSCSSSSDDKYGGSSNKYGECGGQGGGGSQGGGDPEAEGGCSTRFEEGGSNTVSFFQPPYLQQLHRLTSAASASIQGLHQQLCGPGGPASWGTSSPHAADQQQLGRPEEAWLGGKVVGAIVSGYCGLVGFARQAAVWMLQVGLNVAGMLGDAADEVLQQRYHR